MRMRNRLLMAFGALGAAGIMTATQAHADGYLTQREQDYADAVYPVICSGFAKTGVTGNTAYAMARSVSRAGGFAMDDAIDIINYAVHDYCPQFWPTLVAIGSEARAGSYA